MAQGVDAQRLFGGDRPEGQEDAVGAWAERTDQRAAVARGFDLVERALMGVADKRVLLVDSSKFGVTALIRLAELSEFDVVLTDSGIAPTEAETLRQNGVNLRIVQAEPAASE